jgi:hypothetical protein
MGDPYVRWHGKRKDREKQTLGLKMWMCIRGTAGLVESWNLMCFNELC